MELEGKGLGVALLSGKGGAGKTVIALSMARVLSESGVAILLVDADLATHGATYFLQDQLEARGKSAVAALDQLILIKGEQSSQLKSLPPPLAAREGFHFVPSSLTFSLNDSTESGLSALRERWRDIVKPYDVIIYDCQAGSSHLTAWALEQSARTLIVLEPDAISTAALRTLVTTHGGLLPARKTWQVFNKLTPEEREIYAKVSGGMIFANLPPIPFDWEVRATFALGQIPGLAEKGSAFGLAVLRIMNTMLLHTKVQRDLEALELRTIGTLYDGIDSQIKKLSEERSALLRSARGKLIRLGAITVVAVTTLLGGVLIYGVERVQPSSEVWVVGIGLFLGLAATVAIFQVMVGSISHESLDQLNQEIEKYETLLATDPVFREYARGSRGSHKPRTDVMRILSTVPGVRSVRIGYDSVGLIKRVTLVVDPDTIQENIIARARLQLKEMLNLQLSEGTFSIVEARD